MRAALRIIVVALAIITLWSPAWAYNKVLAKACLFRAWGTLPEIPGMKVQSSSIDYKESHRILNVDNDIFVGQVAVTAFDKKAIYEFYCAVHLANRFGEADHARFDEFEMGIVK